MDMYIKHACLFKNILSFIYTTDNIFVFVEWWTTQTWWSEARCPDDQACRDGEEPVL